MKRELSLGIFISSLALILSGTLAVAAPKMGPPPSMFKAAKESKTELIDINTATEEQLKALPGIGNTYSRKIITGRPYTSKEQLVSKKVVPKAAYEKVKDMISATQPRK
jgi:DNA uptake protein ComE-like DNA-binding protein